MLPRFSRHLISRPRRTHIQDVADAYPVRMSCASLPDAVGMLGVEVVDTRIRTVDPGTPRAKAGRSHEARYTSPARTGPDSSQLLMQARRSVGAATRFEDGRDPMRQSLVLLAPCALRPSPPRVIPSAADTQEGTRSRYREAPALRLDEGEDIRLLSEQNRMAFFRSSCSSWSRA